MTRRVIVVDGFTTIIYEYSGTSSPRQLTGTDTSFSGYNEPWHTIRRDQYLSQKISNKYISRLYETGGPKRSAIAVPPGPPPVSIELAAVRIRGWFAKNTAPSPMRSSLASPRRHERQSTCIRSRRKLRTWERQ